MRILSLKWELSLGAEYFLKNCKFFSTQMSQPEFVFNERTMGIMGQDAKGNRKYFEKASFSLTLLKHVDAGGQDSGFLCLVKCSITGEDRYHII